MCVCRQINFVSVENRPERDKWLGFTIGSFKDETQWSKHRGKENEALDTILMPLVVCVCVLFAGSSKCSRFP